ncbi:hypothetical protein MXAZACID_03083 [Acidocella sp. MX-AZ02]|nr:hypothetical protein MXAZACID_03083 [Acidocella sp. MX-AZ02]
MNCFAPSTPLRQRFYSQPITKGLEFRFLKQHIWERWSLLHALRFSMKSWGLTIISQWRIPYVTSAGLKLLIASKTILAQYLSREC